MDDFDFALEDCLFCSHSSKTLEDNIVHMSKKHRCVCIVVYMCEVEWGDVCYGACRWNGVSYFNI